MPEPHDGSVTSSLLEYPERWPEYSSLQEIRPDSVEGINSGIAPSEPFLVECIISRFRAIFPGKHLFRDDVRIFADAAREQLRVFEDGRADLVIVVAREKLAHLRIHPVPEIGVGREQVASSADSLNHKNSFELPVSSFKCLPLLR